MDCSCVQNLMTTKAVKTVGIHLIFHKKHYKHQMQFKNERYDTVIENSIPHELGIQQSSHRDARGEKEGDVAMGSLRIL